MSARITIHNYSPYAVRAESRPIDFAGDTRGNAVKSGSPASRPGLLLRAALVATVLLAALTSFAAVTSGPKPVKSGPLATAPPPTAAHLSSTSFVQPIGSGFAQPEQIAIDSSGNLYIADSLTNNVSKETLVDGVYTQSILRANLGGPIGVTVDSSGNVYIADSDNSRILLEKLETNGTYTEIVVPTTGLGGIVFDLAVDTKGNLYIADSLNNRIVKETPSGGSYTQSVIPATGLSSPEGIAVDSHGDLYIADTFNDQIVKETVSGATYTQSVIVPAVLPLGPAGVNAPQQIFLVGDTLYIADTLNNRIAKATYDGTTKTYTLTTVATASLSAPLGVALDGHGNVFIADSNNKRVIEQAPGESTNFGSWPVGQTSTTATLTFTFDNGGEIGAPVILTNLGTVNTFSSATGTCTKGSTFATGKTCTIRVTFKPSSAGFSYGVAELRDSSNNVLASVDLTGAGIAPVLIYPANAFDYKLGTGLSSPEAVAIDVRNSIVYIADTDNNQVLKETPSSATSYVQRTVVTSLKSPNSVAVDQTGNVFITDAGNKRVIEETPATGGTYTQTVIYAAPAHGAATTDPGPLAVDRDGNVWISFTGSVQEYSLVSGTWTKESQLTVIGFSPNGAKSALLTPLSLAIDPAGNIYVGEPADATIGVLERIMRFSPGGSSYSELLVEQGVYPKEIAIDRIGNIFLINNASRIYVFVPTDVDHKTGNLNTTVDAGFYVGTELNTQTSLNGPAGLAVDANGVVYIANSGSSQVLHESWSSEPGFNFQNVVVDSTSSAITENVLSIGNANFDFAVPTTGQNPTVSSPFVLNTGATTACPVLTASSDPESLVPGDECSVSLSFSPTAVGSVTGSLTYKASSGFGFGFQLSGAGIAPVPSISWPAPASIVYGTPLSATQLNATASYNGQNVPGTFTYNPGLGAVLGAGTQTIKVQFTPSTGAYSNASASVTISVTKAQLIVVADSFSRPYGSPNPTFTASFIGFVNGDGPGALGGAFSFATEATQQFPWGYYPITISSSGPQYNYDVTLVDGTLVITQATLTVTADDQSMVQGQDVPPLSYSITGFVNNDSSLVVSGDGNISTTATSSSPTGTYPITVTQGSLTALNYNFTFVAGTLTISSAMDKPVKHKRAAIHTPAANHPQLKATSLSARKMK